MKKILAKKIEMTQIFDESGTVFPVTLVVEDIKGRTLDTDSQSSTLKEGELVNVSGISKGKGFQGPMRRYHFAGGPATHGSKFHRIPGSSGSGTTPGEVKKGKRRAGHLGGEQACSRNLKVIEILADKNVILIKGAVPGPIGSLCWVEA